VGLRFTHDNGARGDYWFTEMLGAGGALFDYDNDGDLDVFLVQGMTGDPSSAAARTAATATSKLFRNDLDKPGGTLKFTDVTREAGVGLVAQGMGAAVGDIDGDGDLDLYVTTFGDNVLYRNDGNGRFTDVTATANANDTRWSTSAAFVDYDRDGDLDLFIANYVDFTPAGNKLCREPAGGRDYCAPVAYRSVPDRLLRNRGNGTFEDVSEAAGTARADGNGLGVAIGDYDDDGWPDIYVANDATPNQLWMNRRDGTFEDMGPLSGTAYNAAGRPEGSMGVASGDYDRDGDEDLVVTNLVGETFVLYQNDGTGGFEDRRAAVGIAAPTATMTGFGTDWFDADNDGWFDLFFANGAVNLIQALRGSPHPFRQKNQLLMARPTAPAPGRPATVRFVDVSAEAGPAFVPLEVSRGAAFGDIDRDGDIDILVTRNGGPVALYRNNASAGNAHWVQLRLTQPTGNRFAIGARVRIDIPGAPPIIRRVRSDGSYLVASDVVVHVGLGTHGPAVAAEITWPDGTRQKVTGLAVDRRHTVVKSASAP
ncbi:MAG TPA: CRTAC1 family protein, partial [Luteitalea sp.]|nr:CRTAC1 family protein [Luteitalea sp.]